MLVREFVDFRSRPPGLVAVENPFCLGMGLEQCGHLPAQVRVVAAGLVHERLPLRGRLRDDGEKDFSDSLEVRVHGRQPRICPLKTVRKIASGILTKGALGGLARDVRQSKSRWKA